VCTKLNNEKKQVREKEMFESDLTSPPSSLTTFYLILLKEERKNVVDIFKVEEVKVFHSGI
jgi:hypothetical protein